MRDGRDRGQRSRVLEWRRWWRRHVLAPFHQLRGLYWLRRGRLPAAEEALARAVLLAPQRYRARLLLGRVYFLLEEYARAEQQFACARRLDPERFAREELPRTQGRGASDLDLGPEDSLFGDYEAEAAIYACEEQSPEDTGFRYGDFSSYAEWRRFQDLPPIRPEEIREVDWDSIFSDPRSSGS